MRLWLLIPPVLLALAHPAFAAEPVQAPSAPTPAQLKAARKLFEAASKDEEAQHWADALEKLQRVAAVKLTAGVRYHIAVCEENLGQTATAFSHYNEALEAARQEHNKEVEGLLVDPFLPNLRARVPQLVLDVSRDVSGVDVKLDGHSMPAGLLGVATPVDPGMHHVEANAPGREPFTKDLVLHERDVVNLEISLRAVAVAPPPPSKAVVVALPPSPPPREAPVAAHRSFVLPITLGVGALVLGGVGVGAYAAAGSAQSQGLAECPMRTNCDSLIATVHEWDALALGTWIGAGVLATAAVIVVALPTKSSSVRVTGGPGVLRLEGSF